MALSVSHSSPYTLLTRFMSWIDSKFTYVHNGILVITQSCIGISGQHF